ncbi:MAG TPA: helix-turn-helix transcriptional regulator [Caulobacteraceae bacterium]|nr:helix-turn-helix transcriptional regulator [Caulobacteraceae bacterium]
MASNRRSANPLDVAIGARLRVRRRAAGLSQQKLAERLGVTFQQVQKYERGSNRIAGSTLISIAEALDTPASYFLGEGAGGAVEDEAMVNIAQRGASDLLKQYVHIRSSKVRAALLQLVRALAEDGEPVEE